MWIGPDNQHTTAEFQLTQANIDLRLPVGNGLDVKVGYFGTVVGYEVYESVSYTHLTLPTIYSV